MSKYTKDSNFSNHIMTVLSSDLFTHSHERLKEVYLDWANNFLTVERFMEYYYISDIKIARSVIKTGRLVNSNEL